MLPRMTYSTDYMPDAPSSNTTRISKIRRTNSEDDVAPYFQQHKQIPPSYSNLIAGKKHGRTPSQPTGGETPTALKELEALNRHCRKMFKKNAAMQSLTNPDHESPSPDESEESLVSSSRLVPVTRDQSLASAAALSAHDSLHEQLPFGRSLKPFDVTVRTTFLGNRQGSQDLLPASNRLLVIDRLAMSPTTSGTSTLEAPKSSTFYKTSSSGEEKRRPKPVVTLTSGLFASTTKEA